MKYLLEVLVISAFVLTAMHVMELHHEFTKAPIKQVRTK